MLCSTGERSMCTLSPRARTREPRRVRRIPKVCAVTPARIFWRIEREGWRDKKKRCGTANGRDYRAWYHGLFSAPARQLPRISINCARSHHTVHSLISLTFNDHSNTPTSLGSNYQGKRVRSCRANRSKQYCYKWGYRIARGKGENIMYRTRN